MVEGAIQGFVGALAGLALLAMLYSFVGQALAGSDLLVVAAAGLHFLSAPAVLLVLCSGFAVGIFGSYYAVRRFVTS